MPTQSEIAKHLDLASTRSVRELRDSGKIPDLATSTLDAIRVAYIRSLRRAASGRIPGGPGQIHLVRERARLAKELADTQAMKNAERKAELVPAADAEHAVVMLLSGVRTQLLAIPASTAEELAAADGPKECHALVEQAIHQALQAIADGRVDLEPARGNSPRSRPNRGGRRRGAASAAKAQR